MQEVVPQAVEKFGANNYDIDVGAVAKRLEVSIWAQTETESAASDHSEFGSCRPQAIAELRTEIVPTARRAVENKRRVCVAEAWAQQLVVAVRGQQRPEVVHRHSEASEFYCKGLRLRCLDWGSVARGRVEVGLEKEGAPSKRRGDMCEP